MKNNRHISFIEQLKKTFILVILLPVLLLGSFIFISSYRYVNEQKKTEISNIIEQNCIDLDNRMNQCENSLRYIAANYSLQQFLQMDEQAYRELANAETTVGPLIYNTLLSQQYYKRIQVYTNKHFQVMNDLLENAEEVQDQIWYQKSVCSTETCWWYMNDKYYISRRIQSDYPERVLGVLLVELKPEILESSFNIFEQYPVQISLKDKEMVEIIYGADVHIVTAGYSKETELYNEQWSLLYQVPKSFFHNHMLYHLLLPIIFMCIVLLMTWTLFKYKIKKVVRDLNMLVERVNQVEEGSLDIEFEPTEITEIQVLTTSIERMLAKIKKLIRQVYTKEIERQDLELNLLQSKISPHFLYNNLSAINWIAIENHQDKIYEITTEMASFYRSALNRGKNVDKLAVEIVNIKAYINLQLISHEYSFDVAYEIDESLLEQDIPIFIMQPLVENAIEHGIDELRDKRGLLKITVSCRENTFELSVFDNGNCLYNQIGSQILDKSQFGYGTSNVNRRIHLFYGNEYGLEIRASKEGTEATIQLKVNGLKKIYEKEY